MKNQLLLILCAIATFACAVVEATATLPQVAIQNLPLCAQACLTSAFVACPCPLLDLTCACTCSNFVSSIRNCTQSSCSPSFVPNLLNLVSSSCETAISRPAESTTSPSSLTSSQTSTGGSVSIPAVHPTSATPHTTPQTTPHTMLPLTTYANPGSTGTGTVYGGPTPCPSQTGGLSPSDCGPTINPSSVAVIMFIGAAGANYTLSVKLDNSNITTNNPLSISTVSSSIDIPYLCTLHTIDNLPVLVEGPSGIWAVGTPQTVLSIACGSAHISSFSKLKMETETESTSSNLTNSPTTSASYLQAEGVVIPLVLSMSVSLLMYILT